MAERLGAASPDVDAVAARVGDKRTHVLVRQRRAPSSRRSAHTGGARDGRSAFGSSSRAGRRCASRARPSSTCRRSSDDEAVALFCERAQAVRPDLESNGNCRELCERLDRLPLALELAAARTKVLTPEALLERLVRRLDVLKGTRDADERHATLRATIAWSHDLLEEREQRLFATLCVFRGGCTLESAEAVCDADLDTLASLLDKSLLRRRTGRLGEERYWMLETIREFAAERLEEAGGAELHPPTPRRADARDCEHRALASRGRRPTASREFDGFLRNSTTCARRSSGRSRPTSCSPPSSPRGSKRCSSRRLPRTAAVDGGAPGKRGVAAAGAAGAGTADGRRRLDPLGRAGARRGGAASRHSRSSASSATTTTRSSSGPLRRVLGAPKGSGRGSPSARGGAVARRVRPASARRATDARALAAARASARTTSRRLGPSMAGD